MSINEFADNEFLFTSESVSEGHPDKMADQISDAVLDAVLAQDPLGRVACETFVTTGLIVVGGEISTTANLQAFDATLYQGLTAQPGTLYLTLDRVE